MRNLTNVANVEEELLASLSPFRTQRMHAGKKSIQVISVARILSRALICLSTSEAMQARNRICVVSVINALAEVQTS